MWSGRGDPWQARAPVTRDALDLSVRPQALLLDVGDTLAFFDAAAMAAALAGAGVAVAPERLAAGLAAAKRRYQAHMSRTPGERDGWGVLVRGLLAEAGLTDDAAVLAAVRRAHMEFNFWRRVPDGLAEALGRARARGLRLAVVSNSEGRVAELLARLELLPHFEVVVDSHLEGVQKPDPRIFARALARLGVAPERAVYAGDIPEVDVLGARAAGMAGVLIDPDARHAASEWPRVDSVARLIDLLLALPQ